MTGDPQDPRSATGPLGILAAGGALPLDIARAAEAAGRSVHIVGLTGIADAAIAAHPHEWASLGQISRLLGSLRRAGCREMLIAGALQRPDLTRQRIDLGFLRHLPTVVRLTRGGDDSVLRKVIRFFEGEGFVVRGIADVAPHLLAGGGALGRLTLQQHEVRALDRGARLMQALGPFDIGQAIVATPERIVAVEGVTGTDAMLRALGPGSAGDGLARGGVLVKLAKPGQDLRVDLPTIGPTTIERATAAGLSAVVVSAGAAIILQRDATIAAADAAGLALAGTLFDPRPQEPGVDGPVNDLAAAKPLDVLARRAPTPAERRDIGLARRLLPVLAGEGAGRAAVVAREHVLAVPAGLPLQDVVRSLAGRRDWGLRAFRKQIGVLSLDRHERETGDPSFPSLDLQLFEAVRDAGLAGIVCFGGAGTGEDLKNAIGWANDAKVFLMAEASTP